jgi:galactosylceramidase
MLKTGNSRSTAFVGARVDALYDSGDEGWQNYEVGADVYLNDSESAAVMGRINHVGTGYGSVPKGYFLQLDQNGECRLVLIRGQKDKENPEGGESVLGAVRLNNAKSSRWHNLRLRFDGSNITALVDGNVVLRATDTSHAKGMVGLMTWWWKENLACRISITYLFEGCERENQS